MAVLIPSLDELHQLVTPLNEGELKAANTLSSLPEGWTVYAGDEPIDQPILSARREMTMPRRPIVLPASAGGRPT